jgi:hypothetical protein
MAESIRTYMAREIEECIDLPSRVTAAEVADTAVYAASDVSPFRFDSTTEYFDALYDVIRDALVREFDALESEDCSAIADEAARQLVFD